MRFLIVSLMLVHANVLASILNGSFENDMENWSIKHDWYAKPKDAGLSTASIAVKEGQNESKALKIMGNGRRGLVMQIITAYPGQYKVTGWIKCQKLSAGQAGILFEWIDKTNKWMRGDWAFKVSGDSDWQRFETIVTAPPATRSVHIDLLTTEPNNGSVWFDEITVDRLPSNTLPPIAPVLSAATPEGSSGALEITWDPKALVEGTVSLILYCNTKSLKHIEELAPRTILDSTTGRGRIEGLINGKTYQLAVVAVDADGRNSPLSTIVKAKPEHRQSPRSGWITARRLADKSHVCVSWSPHILNENIDSIHIVVPDKTTGKTKELLTEKVTKVLQQKRPFYCTTPWVNMDIDLPQEIEKVGIQVEDKEGLTGEIVWVEIIFEPPPTILPCKFWTTPPTENVSNFATRPTDAQQTFNLSLLQNQTKGYQLVLRPDRELHRFRLDFDSLKHEDGRSEIDTRWIAWHFVEYVKIDEKINRLIHYLGNASKNIGSHVKFVPSEDYPIAYAKNVNEILHLLTYMEQKGYLTTTSGSAKLEYEGWTVYEKILNHPEKLNQAFVAMWFGSPNRIDELKSVYDNGIRKAIEDAELSPKMKALRIDLLEHNDPIDDRILVEIKKSRFMVADFTGHRGGVYFEVGYALGHQIPVIWTCKKDDADKMHFDTRQFSRIEWENEQDLYEKLKRRIEGSIF